MKKRLRARNLALGDQWMRLYQAMYLPTIPMGSGADRAWGDIGNKLRESLENLENAILISFEEPCP